ncbi:MAG: YHS domain-containing (seleno)protein [Pseudomonadales bacterium]
MKKIALAMMVAFFSVSSFAADPQVYSHESKGAIKGTDPVAYFSLTEGTKAVPGREEFSSQWNGATWYFSSQENKASFDANPVMYAPQYGGYCAFAVSHGFTKPTDPNAWKIVDGKLYLNLSKGVQKKWLKDVPGNIAKADSNWPKVLGSH